MPLTPGSKLGQYEILAPLGAGGMGEVYRARDTRLARDVAVKALPDEFARDPERLARFEREAKLLASLTHPNMAGIFGIEDVDGHRYLILEFVEGDTLAQRLDRGTLSIEDALQIAAQIAAALEAAHEAGIVHRDLKPGNVMITPAGDAKVLDFGLAKSGTGSASASDVNLTHSPTLTHQVTGAGVILGTAAYMSPEQARGRAVDKRTDIWSFGCVLYECLTGRQCFAGDTVSDLIARILEREPDWEALPSRTPSRIRSLLRRCLEKDIKRRLRDIGDARIEIEDVISTRESGSGVAHGSRSSRTTRRRFVAATGLIIATATATWQLTMMMNKPASMPATRFEIADDPGMRFNADGVHQAISPDGSMIAFVAADSASAPTLWIRSMESLSARPLPGTELAQQPFWSPDSKYVGYFARQNRLMKIAVDGGQPEFICETTAARGGTWNRDGVIVFSPLSEGPLYRVSANGGESTPITTLDSTETAHRYPYFLPDGKRFLFSALPPHDGKFTIWLGSLDGSERRKVLDNAGTGAVYAAPGHLVYQRDDVLVAVRFDAGKGQVTGEPVPLGDRPLGTGFSGAAPLSVSTNGTLAYLRNVPFATRLVWTDLAGNILSEVPMVPGAYTDVNLAPDGRHAILKRSDGVFASDLWSVDLERGVVSRFSYDTGFNENQSWSPDGSRVAYQQAPANSAPCFVVASVGTGAAVQRFMESDDAFKFLSGWTPDGKALVFSRQEPKTRRDIWVLPLDGSDPWPYLVTPYVEESGEVSSDGRWMLYNSDESGRTEVYVQAYPQGGAKYQVTTGGAFNHGWSKDGTRIYYSEAARWRVVYAVDVISQDPFRVGRPHQAGQFPEDMFDAQLAPDGKRLLMLLPNGIIPPQSIAIVQNWPSLLKKH